MLRLLGALRLLRALVLLGLLPSRRGPFVRGMAGVALLPGVLRMLRVLRRGRRSHVAALRRRTRLTVRTEPRGEPVLLLRRVLVRRESVRLLSWTLMSVPLVPLRLLTLRGLAVPGVPLCRVAGSGRRSALPRKRVPQRVVERVDRRLELPAARVRVVVETVGALPVRVPAVRISPVPVTVSFTVRLSVWSPSIRGHPRHLPPAAGLPARTRTPARPADRSTAAGSPHSASQLASMR
jgi:hypothetical protein